MTERNVYVAGAPRRQEPGGWFGSQHAQLIEDVFRNAQTIFFPPRHIREEPKELFSEVFEKISASRGGIMFIAAKSSGPLVELGLFAAQNKPQVIVASNKIHGSVLLRGLPNIVGRTNFNNDYEIERLLYILKDIIL